MKIQLTGIIEKEGKWYVALCPELNVVSQGETVGEARANLTEALELFFECADEEEVNRRLVREAYVTPLENIADRLDGADVIAWRPDGEMYVTPIEIAHG